MFRVVAIVTLVLVAEASHSVNLAPSDNEAHVNKANAQRQLAVNQIAARVGAGTGTAHLDGVPGTLLAKSRAYHARGSYHGSHGAGYGSVQGANLLGGYGAALPHAGHQAARPYVAHTAGYGANKLAVPHAAYNPHASAYPVAAHAHTTAYQVRKPHGAALPVHAAYHGFGAYGRGAGYGVNTATYGNAIRAYVARGAGYGSTGYGVYRGYNAGYAVPYGGYGARYGVGYGYSQQDNAQRQHQVNLLALHKGSGVGTAPIYGVPGTYLAGHGRAPRAYTRPRPQVSH